MNSISDKIKDLRKRKSITLEELSKHTKIPMSTLKDIEEGRFDKYTGEELYVKNYLKKIGEFLEAENTNEIVDEYIHYTQEIALTKLQEEAERKQIEPEKVIASKNIGLTRKTSVYEDRYLVRYAKYAVAVVLVIAIVAVVWLILVSSVAGNDAPPPNDTEAKVEVNPDAIEQPDETAPEDTTNEQEKLEITNTKTTYYDISGFVEGDNVKIEVIFGASSAFNLWRDGQSVEGAYKANYAVGETYTYDQSFEENQKFTLNVWNDENVVVKVNDQVIEYNPDNVYKTDGVSYFFLTMKGSTDEPA